jgi:hypothetical protein
MNVLQMKGVKNARGAQENLWPKFILWSAPLRATSSAPHIAPPGPMLNR